MADKKKVKNANMKSFPLFQAIYNVFNITALEGEIDDFKTELAKNDLVLIKQKQPKETIEYLRSLAKQKEVNLRAKLESSRAAFKYKTDSEMNQSFCGGEKTPNEIVKELESEINLSEKVLSFINNLI